MPVATPPKKVLVIDDDQSMSGTMQRKFQKIGFAAQRAGDGEEGLDIMRKERFDCILLDLQMPRKNGFEVLRERGSTLNADTPVFVFTASEPRDRELATQLGARKAIDRLAIESPLAVAKEVAHDLVAA